MRLSKGQMLLGVLITVSVLEAAALERWENTSLRLPQQLSARGFGTSNAFPGLTFSLPVGLVSAPGDTNRLFIIEARGRIQVITNLSNPNKTLFLDLSSRVYTGGSSEAGLLGLAFHPGWRTNGYFYVFYTLNTTTPEGSGFHDRLSRFSISATNPNQAVATSESALITQFDEAGNHNAGDLHFAPDGYLYVSLGDEGGSGNQYDNAQRIDKDFFSGILRLDVDGRPGSLNPNAHPAVGGSYRVPSDNPFVGASAFNGLAVDPRKVRTEFWAVGLRNPWRFSFDAHTGYLYCADVGQSDREEIDIIVKGGNYGWDHTEGNLAYSWNRPPSGAVLINPILDYKRNGSTGDSTREGNCVIGGIVYRGNRLTDLWGHYVFGDYASGNIWAVQYDGVSATNFRRLTGVSEPSGFGADPSNGDLLITEHSSGIIRRLIYSSATTNNLPGTLAETGAFADLVTLVPQAGDC
jgi:glucose/arabinose dehydrogenase